MNLSCKGALRLCLALAALVGGWALMVWPRVQAVDAAYSTYSGCDACLGKAVWAADYWWLLLLLLITVVGACTRRRWVSGMGGVAVLVLVLLYLVDLFIFKVFGARLHPGDILRYGGDAGSAASVVAPVLRESWVRMALAGGLLCGLAYALAQGASRVSIAPLALMGLVAVGGAIVAASVGDVRYVHAQAYRNVWASWVPSGEDRGFSSAFKAKALAHEPELRTTCVAPAAHARPRSVVLVVVESLSAYHSRLMGGHLDATPRMDALLAEQGSRFETMLGNGFTTDGGLIALLTARTPLPGVGRFKSSQAYRGYEQPYLADFYQRLHEAGYSSQFFTTGRLDFLGKGDWLRQLGFQTVEGAESPFYQGLPKGSFDDVGDAYLYQRYLAWLDARARGREASPVFSVLLTVSTHPPFVVPGTTIRDQLGAFRYADQSLAEFHAALTRRGFFERGGVLMVVGDHRAMTVLDRTEVERFGVGAGARIWAGVFGHGDMTGGMIPGRWQQADLLPTLAYWAGMRSCTDAYRGRFAGSQAEQAHWALHAQGQDRDHLLAWPLGEAAPATMLLKGDDTHWLQPPADAGQSEVLADVNRWRATLPALDPDEVSELVTRRLGLAGQR